MSAWVGRQSDASRESNFRHKQHDAKRSRREPRVLRSRRTWQNHGLLQSSFAPACLMELSSGASLDAWPSASTARRRMATRMVTVLDRPRRACKLL